MRRIVDVTPVRLREALDEGAIVIVAGFQGFNRDTRDIIMDPRATELGMGWYQEPSGKIWWVMVTGGAALSACSR